VYIGSNDTHKIACGGGDILKKNNVAFEFGILKKECDILLKPFLRYQEKNFVFFKWAQRLDGSTTGGIISSNASRNFVHTLRDACDLIVIGGNTVRIDRPRLDSRLVGGKAPDVLIYSRFKDFDRSIPLFSVPDRKVIISDSLEAIQHYKCIMIEGSEAMFENKKSQRSFFSFCSSFYGKR